MSTQKVKKQMIACLLRELGHPVLKEEALSALSVRVARKIKVQAGLDPGPNSDVTLNFPPKQPLVISTIRGRSVSRAMVESIISELGADVNVGNVDALAVSMVREAKSLQNIDPGPFTAISARIAPRQSAQSVSKNMAIEVLRELGYPIPSGEQLEKAVVTAARKVKSEKGIDPGPGTQLRFTND